LWVTKRARNANANPITYQGKNGKQYVAVIATDSVSVFALPSCRAGRRRPAQSGGLPR
jgi:hypothetical protein